MEDARTDGVAAKPDAVDSHARANPSARLLDRFLPVEALLDACWIAGAVAVLGSFRAVAYHPLQVLVSDHVASPGAEELGFALRATAIADAIWVLLVGLLAWALFRFTRAPKAVALYLVLAGVLLGAVSLGTRLALDTVMVLASPEYHRSLWSDLQPMMLTLAETVGIVLGAWLAHVASGARSGEGGTLLPALGLEGGPLRGAALLAVVLVVAGVVGRLAANLLIFGPEAYQAVWFAWHAGESLRGDGLVDLVYSVGPVLVYFLVGYLGVRRFGVPRSVWFVFLAAGLPIVVAALQLLPAQLAAGSFAAGFWAVATVLVAWPMSALPTFLGVWLATRPARVSVSSDTLSAEDRDHW
jgi:hypothetical protein